MRIFLFLALFLGLSIMTMGQSRDDELSQHNESKTYQAQTTILYHQVSKGETLYRIAKQNEVSIDDLKLWNNLNSNTIIAGSSLKIQKTDYVIIEEPQLPEPELLAISMDENFTANIIENCVEEVNKNSFATNLAIDENSFKQGQLLSITNNIEHRYKLSMKKNIFDDISNATNTAFHAAKNWGGSIIEKVKLRKDKQTEIFYADNLTEIPESTSQEKKNTYVKKRILERDGKQEVIPLKLSVEIPANLETEINKEEFLENSSDFKKIYHRVRIGETMTQIAHRYNVDKEDIIRWNNLNSSIAKIKQRLLIYKPKTSAALTNTTEL
ncbi:MAG: LysM peptidoglycan-binding domain-containing protein [Dysgonomonas sp.]